jgi:hypothetical protein
MQTVKTINVPSLGIGFPDGEGPSMVIASGITTADGNIGGTTLVDDALASLTGKVGLMIWIITGSSKGQVRFITIHAANTLTVDAAFATQILAGTSYMILPIYGTDPAIAIDLNVPAVDDVVNLHERDVIGNKADTPVIVLGVVASLMAYVKGLLAQVAFTIGQVALAIASPAAALAAVAYTRQAGVTQIFQKSITSAANAGVVTVATVTTAACVIKSITLKAVTAAQVDLTSAAIQGGTAAPITFISAVTAAKVNITSIDQQVGWTGVIELAAAKTVVITLVGTGATPVNLLVTIEYESAVSGGFLS